MGRRWVLYLHPLSPKQNTTVQSSVVVRREFTNVSMSECSIVGMAFQNWTEQSLLWELKASGENFIYPSVTTVMLLKPKGATTFQLGEVALEKTLRSWASIGEYNFGRLREGHSRQRKFHPNRTPSLRKCGLLSKGQFIFKTWEVQNLGWWGRFSKSVEQKVVSRE